MYAGVPKTWPVRVSAPSLASCARNFARPKSRSFAVAPEAGGFWRNTLAGFALEPCPKLRSRTDLRAKDLHGDLAHEARVERPIHRARAALAQSRDDSVPSVDVLSDHESNFETPYDTESIL